MNDQAELQLPPLGAPLSDFHFGSAVLSALQANETGPQLAWVLACGVFAQVSSGTGSHESA
jgi:hypothetical protein